MTTPPARTDPPVGRRLDRRGAVAQAAVAATVLVGVAAWLVPWDWVPGGELTPMPVAELFAAEEVRRAEEFSGVRRALGWSSYAVSLLVAVVLGLTPLGARLLRRVLGRRRWWTAVPLAALLLLVVGRLATLPFALAVRAQNVEYGLTTQTLAGWVADQGRSLLVGLVSTGLALVVLVGLARRRPRDWYVAGGAVAVMLTFAGSFLYPVLVEPLFNRFTPMPSGEFKASVLRLADREGVPVGDVLVADASRRTTTLNAYVSGLGGTRRVVVYDTLLEGLTPAQARAVIAHELAHAKHRDVLLGTSLGALGGVVGVSLLALVLDSDRLRRRAQVAGPHDPAAVASVLALVAVGGLLASPLSGAVSRAVEARADRVALEATAAPGPFVEMQRRLALAAVRDPTPPAWSQLWFGSHPTVLERAGLPASLAEAGR